MTRPPVPIALIVDDAAPVNLMYWAHRDHKHVHLIPNAFLRDFAGVCDRCGAAGKFSVLPMPAGLGRVDVGLNHVPARHLRGFLDIVRKRIAPRFDITVELLTHQEAYDLARKRYLHLFEDKWVSNASVGEMTDYIALAHRILRSAGIPTNGVTSPWATGRDNENRYAEAIARAELRVHRRKFAWYFLHCLGSAEPRWPWVTWQDKAAGLVTVTVPANTHDAFWQTQYAASARAARRTAAAGVDGLLSRDGRRGRVRELFDRGFPITILTHWQSLFSNGRGAGLAGLGKLFGRIQRSFGADVRWTRCSRLARQALRRRQGAPERRRGR